MNSIMNYMEPQKDSKTSTIRLGKYKPDSNRPKTKIVKFRNRMTANKVLASAFIRLKQYHGTPEEKLKVYFSKSLNETEQD